VDDWRRGHLKNWENKILYQTYYEKYWRNPKVLGW
jgi:hypothetical protein